MYAGYLYPYYRSPYVYGYPSFIPYGYNNFYGSSNVIGSAIANQSMNTIGAGAIGGIQVATPTVI